MKDGIKKAALILAYDNGVINKGYTVEEYLNDLEGDLSTVADDYDFEVINDWLEGLSDDELSSFCNGNREEFLDIHFAPDGVEDLLDCIFEML